MTVSLIRSPLTAPLLDGGVVPEAGPFTFIEATSMDDNSRRMQQGDFAVAEMSLATLVAARALHHQPLVAMPIFTGRRFPQHLVFTRAARPLRLPDDVHLLHGRRVGAPQYWLSSSVWHRIVLAGIHGVDLDTLTWHTTLTERDGLPEPPRPVRYRPGTVEAVTDSLADDDGPDLALMPRAPRPTSQSATLAYADPAAAAAAWLEKTGVFPIMHVVVMDRRVAGLPGAPDALAAAFDEARRRAGPLPVTGPDDLRVDEWAYGLERAVPTIDVFLDGCVEQRLVPQRPALGDLFHDVAGLP